MTKKVKDERVVFCGKCKPDHTGKMCYCGDCAKRQINKLDKFLVDKVK